MNKYIYYLILLFSSFIGTNLFSATYKMSNATHTGVCSGTFTDSDAGVGFNFTCYGNNENFTMTFCANAGQYMMFNFTELNIKSGDHLRIYDGPNTSSSLLHDISNQNILLTVVSSGSCITFHFTSDGSGGILTSNGNWSASIQCISPLTIDDPATVYTCGSLFMDSGGENNYGDNEFHVKTICPANGNTCVSIDFTMFDSESGMDFLYIYDGNSAAGAPLLTLSGTHASANVTSSYLNCLTLKFVSNGAVNRSGWKAMVSCGNCVPTCSPFISAVASDNCSSAPEICDLNGYCGNTSSSYTVDEPGNFCDACNLFDGTLENNSWIKFVASDTVANINIYIPDCEDGDGIQIGVYEATNCDNFVLKSDVAWTSGNGAPFQPLQTGNFITASPLTQGMTYYVMIDGWAGAVCDYIITAGSGVSVPMIDTYSQTICNGDQITIGASGASTYSWTSQPAGFTSNSATITVQPTVDTWYYCTMTRTNGNCPQTTIVDSVWIEVDDCSHTCSVNAGNDVEICTGTSTTLNPTVVGNGPYNFTWSPASSLDNANIQNPVASPATTTTYSVTVVTSDGCTATDVVTVTIGNNLSIFVDPQNPVICQNGSITLTASGGSTYQWSPSTGLSATSGAAVNASPGQAMSYTVTGSTTNGCTGTASVTINIAVPVDAYLNASNSQLCSGESTTLSVGFTNPGGGGPYLYSWDNGLGYLSPPIVITPSVSGVYNVTVTDNCGTADAAQLQIIVAELPNVEFTTLTPTGCETLDAEFADASNPVPMQWEWNFGDPASGTSNTSSLQNPVHYFSAPGTYDIMLTVTNAMNCSSTLVKEDFITVFPGIEAEFSYLPEGPTELDMNLEFYDNSVGAISWEWNFGDTSSIEAPVSLLQNPSWAYQYPGTYPVELWVENQYGCKDDIVKDIIIKPDQTWYIPNAFTPNENGINDKFGLFGIGVLPERFEMYIFNRWGEQVFYSRDINVRWDGKLPGMDYVIDGVYLYMFKFQTIDGHDHTIYGYVTAIDPHQ